MVTGTQFKLRARVTYTFEGDHRADLFHNVAVKLSVYTSRVLCQAFGEGTCVFVFCLFAVYLTHALGERTGKPLRFLKSVFSYISPFSNTKMGIGLLGTRPNITTGTLQYSFEKDKEIHLTVVWRG